MPRNTHIIRAGDFQFRKDLEDEVQKIEDKTGYTIEGTREELVRLQLTDLRNVFGVHCVISDNPTEKREFIKADRGEQRAFGLNNHVRNV